MAEDTTAPYHFKWKDLGNISEGRPNLGESTNIAVYRLMQYTLREVLATRYGANIAGAILQEAGGLAGQEFCRNLLNVRLDFNGFVACLQEKLKELNIGILRLEKADLEAMKFVLTISEDLDCSGLPISGETVCEYDEGFISGIFRVYTGREFIVKEVDCWATGERTCRFTVDLAVRTMQ